MSIEVGSKWQHKDGGVYEVVDSQADVSYYHKDVYEQQMIEAIVYKDIQGEIYVRTENHFLQSFKPCEPIYEYRYAYMVEHGGFITQEYYTDEEATKLVDNRQRLDFTKRERQCGL